MRLSVYLATFLAGVVGADTLTVHTANDLTCSGFEGHTFKIGELNKCHPVPDRIRSIWTTDVASSFFGKNIKLRVWDTNDCQPGVSTARNDFSLSNAGGNCHIPFADLNAGFPNSFWGLSFQLVQT